MRSLASDTHNDPRFSVQSLSGETLQLVVSKSLFAFDSVRQSILHGEPGDHEIAVICAVGDQVLEATIGKAVARVRSRCFGSTKQAALTHKDVRLQLRASIGDDQAVDFAKTQFLHGALKCPPSSIFLWMHLLAPSIVPLLPGETVSAPIGYDVRRESRPRQSGSWRPAATHIGGGNERPDSRSV